MAPIQYVGNYAPNWQCGVCKTTHTNQDGFTPWQTPNDGMVCEICIKFQFDQALHGSDAEWPARWGNEELNPRDFASFLSPDYINQYLAKEAEIAAWRRDYQPELLEGLKLGEDYQVCPRCKEFRYLDDDCMVIRCRCLASFCFRCGVEAEDVDGLDREGHWNMRDGCKRYARPESGSEQDGGDSGGSGSEEDSRSAKLERFDSAVSRFNVAMQGAKPQGFVLLRRFLDADTSLSPYEMTIVWNMVSARPPHLSEEEWNVGKRLRERCLVEFFGHVGASRGKERGIRHEYLHVLHGAYLLLHPTGGIYNMSRLQNRLIACSWLAHRIERVGAMDRQNNVAIFNHHDGPDRIAAFDLLYQTLKGYIFVLPGHVVSFDFLGDEAERRHLGIFVRVRERSSPQVDEFSGKREGKINALCGLIVNPKDDTFATQERPVGMYVGSGREEM